MRRPVERDYPTVGAYIKAYEAWENRTIPAPGRARQREIHPSWLPYLEHFDALDSRRSQGAFCRAYGLNRSTFSNAQCRKISGMYDLLISTWLEGKVEEVPNE